MVTSIPRIQFVFLVFMKLILFAIVRSQIVLEYLPHFQRIYAIAAFCYYFVTCFCGLLCIFLDDSVS
jgi:hypothetical protein